MFPTAGPCLPTEHSGSLHLHRPDPGLADTFWHRAGTQPFLLSIPRLLFTYTCISRQPTRMHKLHPTLPMEEQLPFPSSTHAQKRLSETVTSLLYSMAHSSTRSIPRHKQPWTQKPNRTQTCSAIGLTTHLDLTFLKTSSTYSEGCNRGKTPALHIKKHSETNMCLTVHFTQLKKMQSHLVRWTNHYEYNKEPPCSTSQLPVWKFSLHKT